MQVHKTCGWLHAKGKVLGAAIRMHAEYSTRWKSPRGLASRALCAALRKTAASPLPLGHKCSSMQEATGHPSGRSGSRHCKPSGGAEKLFGGSRASCARADRATVTRQPCRASAPPIRALPLRRILQSVKRSREHRSPARAPPPPVPAPSAEAATDGKDAPGPVRRIRGAWRPAAPEPDLVGRLHPDLEEIRDVNHRGNAGARDGRYLATAGGFIDQADEKVQQLSLKNPPSEYRPGAGRNRQASAAVTRAKISSVYRSNPVGRCVSSPNRKARDARLIQT